MPICEGSVRLTSLEGKILKRLQSCKVRLVRRELGLWKRLYCLVEERWEGREDVREFHTWKKSKEEAINDVEGIKWLWVVEVSTGGWCSTIGKERQVTTDYIGPFKIFDILWPIVRVENCQSYEQSIRKLDGGAEKALNHVGSDSERNLDLVLSNFSKGNVKRVRFMRILKLREVARMTAMITLEFALEFIYVFCLNKYDPKEISRACWDRRGKVMRPLQALILGLTDTGNLLLTSVIYAYFDMLSYMQATYFVRDGLRRRDKKTNMLLDLGYSQEEDDRTKELVEKACV
ncbi:hypothetical protein Tco_0739888 [Tanacetum coccineum]